MPAPRRPIVRSRALVAAMLLLAQGAAAGPGPRGIVLSFGTTRDLSEAVRSPEPAVPGGVSVFVETIEIAVETDVIEAKIGTSFGLEYSVVGLQPGQVVNLRKVMRYPPMHLPDGTVSQGFSKQLTPTVARSDGSVANIQGYSFDEPFELVLGVWTIEIWSGETLLVHKDFRVIAPEPAQGG